MELSEVQKKIAAVVTAVASLLMVTGVSPTELDVTAIVDALSQVAKVAFEGVAVLALVRATVWGTVKKLFAHESEVSTSEV